MTVTVVVPPTQKLPSSETQEPQLEVVTEVPFEGSHGILRLRSGPG